MKLEDISRTQGAPADELVPSRYALKVGEIDVMVVSDGILPLPTDTMSTNVAPADRKAWFKGQFLGPDRFDWGLNALLVRSGDQTILVDAGLGSQFPGFPRAGQLPRRLEAAGVPLGSITDVVLTHLHMDHVGGLLVDAVKSRLRPDLRIHVSAAEIDFWKEPDFSRVVMPEPIPEVLRATATQFLELYGDKVMTFMESSEIAPGVVAERTGGHTPGHSIVRVSSAGEGLVFAGDALFPVAFDHPDWQNGFEHDPEEAARIRIRLLNDAAASGDLLVATHLSFPSIGRVAPEGDAFRWVPGIWDY